MIYRTLTKSGEVKLYCYVLDPPKESSRDQIRPAVIICPGGAYSHLSPRESEPIAAGFMAKGFHVFILAYSVAKTSPPPLLHRPFEDLSWAISEIKAMSGEWMVGKLAVMGSSAGGHLAASYCTCYKPEYKANALILSYPVITSNPEYSHRQSFVNLLGEGFAQERADELSPELHVNGDTPPCFLWHTFADESVPVENSLLFVRALRDKKVPFELHIFPNGPHGLSLATPETATALRPATAHVANWFRLCVEWLSELFEWKIR